MPFDPAGLLLGINPTHILKDIYKGVDCSIIFAEAWKQCKHTFLRGWLNDLHYFHKLKYCVTVKNSKAALIGTDVNELKILYLKAWCRTVCIVSSIHAAGFFNLLMCIE